MMFDIWPTKSGTAQYRYFESLPEAIRPVICNLVIASSGFSPNGTEHILLDCDSFLNRVVEAKHRARHGVLRAMSSLREARGTATVAD